MKIDKREFGDDFEWGISTSAYQVEGAHNLDGKGPSIWDDFTTRKGKICNNENANVSCNFYQKYPHDLTLMSTMNIPNYRFSISWSRIFPEGTGTPNKSGVDFYNRVIDLCLELHIKPWITLYHWDLPLALEIKGGWANREIVDWFSRYVYFCINTFGDRVKHWIILNEPMVFTGAGYFLGIHAPGKKSLSKFLAAAHHAALCQAEGARIVKSEKPDVRVGTTFSCTYIEPHSLKANDVRASVKVDALINRMFIEPLLGMGYPFKDLRILNRIEKFVKDGDEQRLPFDMDFIGIQNYTREIIAHSWLFPYLRARVIHANTRNVEKTLMNWEVYPQSIYLVLKRFAQYKNIKEMIVTENGAAFEDNMHLGKINDDSRQQYIASYLKQVLKAKKEGVNVNGYFVWSFTDNFEWAEGYKARFGLVHVDFATQQRIIKSSGSWYSQFLMQTQENKMSRTL